MNLKIKKRAKKKKKSLEFWKTLKQCFFCCKRDEPKNLHKCQTLKLHTRVKNAAQNLNDFNLVAKLGEEDMRESDTKYRLNCLTSLYRREKKINLTHCDDGEIMKGTLVFSFCITASTKFEVSTLTNPAPDLITTNSLFKMLLLNVFLTKTFLQEFRNSLTFTLRIRTYAFKVKIDFENLNQFFNIMLYSSKITSFIVFWDTSCILLF